MIPDTKFYWQIQLVKTNHYLPASALLSIFTLVGRKP
jgi:hypothetical protein